jgi:hypothetical protein
VQEAGWASEPVWTQRLEEKSFAPAGDRLTKFTAVNKLVSMVTMEHNPNPQFSKAHLTTSNFYNCKIIDAMGLKIIASRSS